MRGAQIHGVRSKRNARGVVRNKAMSGGINLEGRRASCRDQTVDAYETFAGLWTIRSWRSTCSTAPSCSLKPVELWDESLRQGRNWIGPFRQELKFGRVAVGSGRGSRLAECRIAEWPWEVGSRKFVVAPVHMIIVLPPAELSSPVMKTQQILIETESADAVTLGWYQIAIKFYKFKFVDDSIDSVFCEF